MFKKNSFVFLLFGVISFSGFAAGSSSKDQVASALSGLRVTSAYRNAFNLYNMDKYSENTFGGTLGYEYTLLPEIGKNFDLGFYGRTAIQNFVPCNVQLKKLYSYTFSGGLFAQWNFPKDFNLMFSGGMGFLISDVDFISAEKGKVCDIYYDFSIESDLSLRKIILKTKNVNLLGSAGCHWAFFNEKSEIFMNIGPEFGLILDFMPFGTKPVAGAKR